MKGKKVLFFDSDRKACRIAERAIAATGSSIETIRNERNLFQRSDLEHFDLIILSLEHEKDWSRTFEDIEKHADGTKLLLNISSPADEYIPMMTEKTYLRNLIAKSDGPLDTEEIIVTTEKIFREDIFGLDKYMMWGVEPVAIKVTDSKDKAKYIGEVSQYATRLGCPPRAVELVETVTDEFVTNAVFNAPRDENGNPKYAHLNRRESVTLSPEEQAELYYCCDGRFLCVAQRDPFGALTRETVINYLARCLKGGPGQILYSSGGAGLGLFRVFKSLSKFIINLCPGTMTEVIALIDLRVNMKKFKQYPKSLHFFQRD